MGWGELPLAVLLRLAFVLVSINIYSYVASCMQYVPIARPSHKQRGRSGAGGVRGVGSHPSDGVGWGTPQRWGGVGHTPV